MIVEQIPEIESLNPSEKLLLVGELWNEIVKSPDGLEVSRDIVSELDRRMEEYERDPNKLVAWEDAKARILGSKR